MIVKLVPMFEGVYARANAALPAPTRLLIAVSGVVRGLHCCSWSWASASCVLLLYSMLPDARAGAGSSTARSCACRCSARSIRKAIMARTCRTLSVLLNAGIPLIEAMETVAQGVAATRSSRTR